MRAAAVPRTEITIGRGTVAVRQDELDRLLKALAALEHELGTNIVAIQGDVTSLHDNQRAVAATVEAFCQNSERDAPCLKARTIGWQPAAWTAIIFGRRAPIQPSCSNSSKAFHMPIMPTPPPVG